MPSTIHQGELVPSSNSAPPPDRNYPTDDAQTDVPALSLRSFFDILRRRKVIALNVFILIVALGVVVTLMTKPMYRTSATILVDGRSNTLSLTNSDPLQSIFTQKSARDIDTQVEILRSPSILDLVYKRTYVPQNLVNVDVTRVDRTDAIDLTFTSTSADAAEKFAKMMPTVYLERTQNDRLSDVTASLDFAQTALDKQNAKLKATEQALANYKSGKQVIDPTQEATSAIEEAATNRADLVKAEVQIASLQATLNSLSAERRKLSPSVVTPITSTNPLIQELKNQIASLRSDRASRLFYYKPNDDEIRKIDVQIEALQSRLNSTPGTVTNRSSAPNPAIDTLDTKISDTRAQLRAAQSSIGDLRQTVTQQNQKLKGYNKIQLVNTRLQRDLLSSSDAFKTLSDSVLQLTLRKKALESATAPVVTLAASPNAEQISPRFTRNLIGAIVLGLLLACGAALLQDSLDDHVRNEEEARRLLNTSVLGYFPMLSSERSRPILDLENPDRQLLESFRALRSNVQFALVNSAGQKLLVTSSVPGEGKSYVASNLAIALALNGKSVILVDTDLHRPTQHEIFNIPRYPGLTNVLIGDAKLRDCVQDVGIPGMRVISAGITPPNPAELLNSAVMDAVIERLGKGADVVIFDSPPLLATADSQVLSSKVDGVIYVMRLGQVPRSAINRSFELLRQARARLIGMVFNQVQEKSGESYMGYYYTDYSSTSEDDDNEDVPLPKNSGAVFSKARRLLQPTHADVSNGIHSDSDNSSLNGNGTNENHDG